MKGLELKAEGSLLLTPRAGGRIKQPRLKLETLLESDHSINLRINRFSFMVCGNLSWDAGKLKGHFLCCSVKARD